MKTNRQKKADSLKKLNDFQLEHLKIIASEILSAAKNKNFSLLLTLEKTLTDEKSYLPVTFLSADPSVQEKLFDKKSTISKDLVDTRLHMFNEALTNTKEATILLKSSLNPAILKSSIQEKLKEKAPAIVSGWEYIQQSEKHPQCLTRQYLQKFAEKNCIETQEKSFKEIENMVIKIEELGLLDGLFGNKTMEDEVSEKISFLKNMKSLKVDIFNDGNYREELEIIIAEEKNNQLNNKVIAGNELDRLDRIFSQYEKKNKFLIKELYEVIILADNVLASLVLKIDKKLIGRADIDGKFIIHRKNTPLGDKIKIRTYLHEFYLLLLNHREYLTQKKFELSRNLTISPESPFSSLNKILNDFLLLYVAPLQLLELYQDGGLARIENEAILLQKSVDQLRKKDPARDILFIKNIFTKVKVFEKIIDGHHFHKEEKEEKNEENDFDDDDGSSSQNANIKRKERIKKILSLTRTLTVEMSEETKKQMKKSKEINNIFRKVQLAGKLCFTEDKEIVYYALLIDLIKIFTPLELKRKKHLPKNKIPSDEIKKNYQPTCPITLRFICKEFYSAVKEISSLLERKSRVIYSNGLKDCRGEFAILSLIGNSREFSKKHLLLSYSNILIRITIRLIFCLYVKKNEEEFLINTSFSKNNEDDSCQLSEEVEKVITITQALLSVNLNMTELNKKKLLAANDYNDNPPFLSFQEIIISIEKIKTFLVRHNSPSLGFFISPLEAEKLIRKNLSDLNTLYLSDARWVSKIKISDPGKDEIKKIQNEVNSLIEEGKNNNQEKISAAEEKLIQLHLMVNGELPLNKENLPEEEELETLMNYNVKLANLIIEIKNYRPTDIVFEIAKREFNGKKEKDYLEVFPNLKNEINLFASYPNSIKQMSSLMEKYQLSRTDLSYSLLEPIQVSEITQLIDCFKNLKTLSDTQKRNSCLTERLKLIEAFLKQPSLRGLTIENGKKIQDLIEDSGVTFDFFSSPMQNASALLYLQEINSPFEITGVPFYNEKPLLSLLQLSNVKNNFQEENKEQEEEQEEEQKEILPTNKENNLIIKSEDEQPQANQEEKDSDSIQPYNSHLFFNQHKKNNTKTSMNPDSPHPQESRIATPPLPNKME